MNSFKRHITAILILITTTISSYGQDSLTIQDPNFAKYLCQTFPTILNSECTKIDSASLYNPSLVNGIMFFESLDIKFIPEITYFMPVDTIYAANNQIEGDLLFDSRSLNFLDLSRNNLTLMPRFEMTNTNEKIIIKLFDNHIKTFTSLDSLHTALVRLAVQKNLLEGLPDFNSFTALNWLDVSQNYLSFEDLIPLLDAPVINKGYRFFPQKNIRLIDSLSGQEHQSFNFSLPVDSAVTTNTYDWYKDNELIATTTVNALSIDDLQMSDSGNYHVVISNTLFPGSSISSESFFLEVTEHPPYNIDLLIYETSQSCEFTLLKFDNSSLSDIVELSLLNSEDQLLIGNENFEFENLTNGSYDLLVTEYNETLTYKDWLIIDVVNPCDQVITPNGDGKQDVMYFEGSGKGLIFDANGITIRSFDLPFSWDATNQEGAVLPAGIYFVQLEDKVVEVTILK